MKNLFFLLLIVLVASCGPKKENPTEIVDEEILDTIVDQVEIKDSVNISIIDSDNSIDNSNPSDKEKENIELKKVTVSKTEITTPKITKIKTSEAVDNEEIVKDLDHSLWNTLLKKNVSSNGKVNYKGFINDKEQLESYLKKLAIKTPDASWSKNAKLAYWINVYNAFTVKLIIDNYPLKSIKNINNPWGKKFIVLEQTNYSLEHVENDILRKMNEPRIHFAINCASYSCPDLHNTAFMSSSLESQLALVTKKFINDTSKNNLSENEIKVSEIFNWFADDFKAKNGSVINFINKYSNITINDDAKVSYIDYNWNLNE